LKYTGLGLVLAMIGLGAWFYAIAAGWTIPDRSINELAGMLDDDIRIFKPEGEGPFPVIVQFHGCGGLRNNQFFWANVARQEGFLAVIVDSFRPRNISDDHAVRTVCTGRQLLGPERAGDVLAALHYVMDRNDADPTRVVLAGWSHGAYAVMDLLSMDLRKTRPTNLKRVAPEVMEGVIGSVLIYPYCGLGARSRYAGWATSEPSLLVVAEEDTVVDANACLSLAKMLESKGHAIEVVNLPGTDHMFDDPDFPGYYSAEASRKTETALRAFLRKLKGELS